MSEPWNFIKGSDASYGYCGCSEIFGLGPPSGGRASMTHQPGSLDEIAEALAAEMATILRHTKGKRILAEIVGITRSVKDFRKAVIPETFESDGFDKRRHLTLTKYQKHFKMLLAWNLIAEVNAADLHHFSKYFSVPKSRTVDRAIQFRPGLRTCPMLGQH